MIFFFIEKVPSCIWKQKRNDGEACNLYIYICSMSALLTHNSSTFHKTKFPLFKVLLVQSPSYLQHKVCNSALPREKYKKIIW